MTPEQKYKRSLRKAIEAATGIAADCGEDCYIIHSEIYANGHHEYENVEHVVGTKAVCACMFDKVGTDPWGHVIGKVDPDGAWFFSTVKDTLLAMSIREKPPIQRRGETEGTVEEIPLDVSTTNTQLELPNEGRPKRKR